MEFDIWLSGLLVEHGIEILCYSHFGLFQHNTENVITNLVMLCILHVCYNKHWFPLSDYFLLLTVSRVLKGFSSELFVIAGCWLYHINDHLSFTDSFFLFMHPCTIWSSWPQEVVSTFFLFLFHKLFASMHVPPFITII